MLVRAWSGAVLELEPPTLRAVLARGGSDEALIDLCFSHQMEPERLRPEDRAFICAWAVEMLAGDSEASEFCALCEQFGAAPSERLRIADPVRAYDCDRAFLVALLEARSETTSDDSDREGGRVIVTTPEE